MSYRRISTPLRFASALAALALASCAQGNGSRLDPDAGPTTDGQTTIDSGLIDASPDGAIGETCADISCFQGVTCDDSSGTPTCGACPTGTEGDGLNCTEVDACAASPCADNVVCTDQMAPSEGFDCGDCPDGFFGNGIVCTDVDSCSGTPCFPGVICTDSAPPEVGFTCGTCPTGFEGDGLTCTDINGCAGNPCASGVLCTDALAPLLGFSCGACPTGQVGDGITCAVGCTPAAATSCGMVVNSSNTATGSATVTTDWGCTTQALAGSEIVYTFVPEAAGIATATLTGLSADLDLLVIKDSVVPGTCDSTSDTVCVPNGYSGAAGSGNEIVRWNAEAGATYYIIVDAFQTATSSFTLEVKTSVSDVLMMEIGLGDDDYVELGNFGACTLDFGGLNIMHLASLDTVATNFVFPANSNVAPLSTLRMVESTSSPFAANEVSSGFNIPDLPAGAGFTALCDGACDTAACTNLLDYVERKDGTTVPTAPACANFAPSSIESAGQSGDLSLQRGAFDGAAAPNDFKASDWAFGAPSRN